MSASWKGKQWKMKEGAMAAGSWNPLEVTSVSGLEDGACMLEEV